MTDLEEFARKCGMWNDQYLLEQYARGPGEYAHGDYFAVIQAEVGRRGLASELPTPATEKGSALPPSGPYLKRLWKGEVSLPETYWQWGVVGNLAFTALFIITSKALPLIAFVVAVVHIPYVGFTAVAIWRSAGRYQGRRVWAVLARLAVTIGVLRTLLSILRAL